MKILSLPYPMSYSMSSNPVSLHVPLSPYHPVPMVSINLVYLGSFKVGKKPTQPVA